LAAGDCIHIYLYVYSHNNRVALVGATFAVTRSRVESKSAWTRADEAARCVAARHIIALSRTRIAKLAFIYV